MGLRNPDGLSAQSQVTQQVHGAFGNQTQGYLSVFKSGASTWAGKNLGNDFDPALARTEALPASNFPLFLLASRAL